MASQQLEHQEQDYQEALEELKRLADSRSVAPAVWEELGEAVTELQRLAGSGLAPLFPELEPPHAPLPARTTSLPAWSEQNFRELIEGLPDAVVVIDARGTIVLVNRQTERLFAYHREELLGAAIELLVPQRLRDWHVGKRNEY